MNDAPSTGAVRRGRGLIALLALVLAGCGGDMLSGPGDAASPFGGISVGNAPAGVPRADVIIEYMAEDSSSADFTVTPTGGVFNLGPHAIYFPANSICDPSTSSYGPGEWDAPCEVLTTPIRFHAEIRHVDGRSYVDFTPAVRFVPTNDPANAVWLYMKTSSLSSDPDSAMAMLRRMSVRYSTAIGDVGVNEALADSSLRTYVWMSGGIAFRRIKHFSGYNVHDGFTRSGVRDVEYDSVLEGDESIEEGLGDFLSIDSLIVPIAY
jgi:hypothetical protein